MVTTGKAALAAVGTIGLASLAFSMRGAVTRPSSDQVRDRVLARISESNCPNAIDYTATHLAISNFDFNESATLYALSRITRLPAGVGSRSGNLTFLLQLPDGTRAISGIGLDEVRSILGNLRDVADKTNPDRAEYLNALWTARTKLLDVARAGSRDESAHQSSTLSEFGNLEQRVTGLLRALVQSGIARVNPVDGSVVVGASDRNVLVLRFLAKESDAQRDPVPILEVDGGRFSFVADLQGSFLPDAECIVEALTAASPSFNERSGQMFLDIRRPLTNFSGSAEDFAVRREQVVSILSTQKP